MARNSQPRHYERRQRWKILFQAASLFTFQISAVADDDGGNDERADAAADEQVRLPAGAFPFVENPAPHGAEDDDARHVQRPGGETELAHLRLAHRVEEKLEIPACPRQCGEQVVRERRNLQVHHHAAASHRAAVFAAAGAAVMGMLFFDVRGEVLVAGAVFDVQ